MPSEQRDEPRGSWRRIGTVALLVGVALVVASCVDGSNAGRVSGDPPSEIVALREDGSVVVLTSDDGSEVRELVPAPEGEATAPGLLDALSYSLTPDGEFLYHTEDVSTAGTELVPVLPPLVRIPVAGGEPETVATGTSPLVSPDGETVAFGTRDPDVDSPEPLTAIGLLDVETGDLEVRSAPAEEGEPAVPRPGPVTWVDAMRLLVAGPSVVPAGDPDAAVEYVLVDAAAEDEPLDANPVDVVDLEEVGLRSGAPAGVGGVLGVVAGRGDGTEFGLVRDPLVPEVERVGGVDVPAYPTDVTDDLDHVLFVGSDDASVEELSPSSAGAGEVTRYVGFVGPDGEVTRLGDGYLWGWWVGR